MRVAEKKQIPSLLIEKLKEDGEIYRAWLKKIDLTIDKNLLLAGPFRSPEYPVWPRYHDNFHFPLGMRYLLSCGFSGIRKEAWRQIPLADGNKRAYLRLIHQTYLQICILMEKFSREAGRKKCEDMALICKALSGKPPGNFRAACQLYWFAIILRIGTATIGRLDQHLYPFYKKDLAKGLITKEECRKLLAELLYRLEMRGAGQGDTLQNITIGGRNKAGKDETNELSFLLLELMLEHRYIEPKINVRLHKRSADYLHDLVSRLQFQGTGICTIYNDDTIIGGLEKYGRPAAIAADYCADGCTEIILDGYGETAFRYIDCVKAVEHTIFNGRENISARKKMQYYDNTQEKVEIKAPVEQGKETGDFLKMKTFPDFYKAYLAQLKYQVDVMLSRPYNADENALRPFTAATMPAVLQKALDPYYNEKCWPTYGLFIGSLGTAVNSIAAVRQLVYEKKLIEKEALLQALQNNFANEPLIRRLCLDAPKFGNDDDRVDAIAADIAKRFASWVKKYKDRNGKPVLPGLYNHLFHHTANYVGATPDGRVHGDPVGEHLSPTPGTAVNGPTAIINSISKITTADQIFGSTLHLNIPLATLQGSPEPLSILRQLTQVFCNKGGCVLNINILDAEKLLDAQKHPEKYRDLVVRVWGFSYYFVGLSKEMQDHVIARSQSVW